ncbi:group II intron reverse transcriptase/maturase [soil metagenome]
MNHHNLNALALTQAQVYRDAIASPDRPLPRLMHHVSAWGTLRAAWRCSRRESDGVENGVNSPLQGAEARAFLQDLAARLTAGTYEPGPVRRFQVPKPGRPDRTRTVALLDPADRVVHLALKLVLEPLVEARLGSRARCFGFRPGLGRLDQLRAVGRLAERGPEPIEAALTADIADCFDRIDHRKLLEDVRSLTNDSDLLALLRRLLEQVGAGQRGWWRRRPVGLLQGSPLSPLLANLHLARLDRAWRRSQGNDSPLFRYADDLIVLARDTDHAQRLRRHLERTLRHQCRLGLSERKTRIDLLDDGVPLLGLLVRRHLDPFDQQRHVRLFLDPQRVRHVLEEIVQWAKNLSRDRPIGPQFEQLNQRLRGWFEAFQVAHDAGSALETLDLAVYAWCAISFALCSISPRNPSGNSSARGCPAGTTPGKLTARPCWS